MIKCHFPLGAWWKCLASVYLHCFGYNNMCSRQIYYYNLLVGGTVEGCLVRMIQIGSDKHIHYACSFITLSWLCLFKGTPTKFLYVMPVYLS